MTFTLMFEGCSDDTFGEYQHFRDDYDNCASGKPIQYKVSSKEGSLLVTGQYCPNPSTGWMIGVSRIDEDDDKPIPNWPISIVQGEREYSPRLIIDAPEDVTIECIQRIKQ